MSRFIVTGASGHIGHTLVKTLCGRGYDVIAIVRKTDDPAVSSLPCEKAVGNFYDALLLGSLLRPGDIVVHCAGMIAITDKDAAQVRRVNYDGSLALFDACEAAKIGRLVYVSSVDAIYKPTSGAPIKEPEEFFPEKLRGCYGKSKAEATAELFARIKAGRLDANVVYPTAVIGPDDYKVSLVGQVIDDYVRNRPMARVNGKYNFVDVRDVADGIIAAALTPHGGSGYILGGEVVTVDGLFEILSGMTGRRLPPKLPLGFVSAFAELGVAYYKVRGKKPVFSRFALQTLNSDCNYDITKAKTELGFSPRPASESILSAAQWFLRTK